jgi:hypothetical protein
MTPVQRAILANGRRSRAWCLNCEWAAAPATADDVASHIMARLTHIVVHDRINELVHTTTIASAVDRG